MASEPRRVEPVRLFADDDVRLPRTMTFQLRKRRAELVEDLAASGPLADPMQMKHVVGKIAGIDEAIGICEQANKELVD